MNKGTQRDISTSSHTGWEYCVIYLILIELARKKKNSEFVSFATYSLTESSKEGRSENPVTRVSRTMFGASSSATCLIIQISYIIRTFGKLWPLIWPVGNRPMNLDFLKEAWWYTKQVPSGNHSPEALMKADTRISRLWRENLVLPRTLCLSYACPIIVFQKLKITHWFRTFTTDGEEFCSRMYHTPIPDLDEI